MRQHQKWPERAEGSVTRARVQRTRMFVPMTRMCVPMTCLVRAAASIDGHTTAAWTTRHQTRYLRAAWRRQQLDNARVNEFTARSAGVHAMVRDCDWVRFC